jgi:hypothetical protein
MKKKLAQLEFIIISLFNNALKTIKKINNKEIFYQLFTNLNLELRG